MIILLIEATVSDANRKAFLDAARRQSEESQKEEGCLAFDILQDPFDPGTVKFFELWRSADDLTAHRDRPHSVSFREKGRPLADALTARKFTADEFS